jgi:hypothetical protein
VEQATAATSLCTFSDGLWRVFHASPAATQQFFASATKQRLDSKTGERFDQKLIEKIMQDHGRSMMALVAQKQKTGKSELVEPLRSIQISRLVDRGVFEENLRPVPE